MFLESIRASLLRLAAFSRQIARNLASRWKLLLSSMAIMAIVLAIGGFLFAWSGLTSISASSGHWAITRWILQFAMHNAVETHAMGVEKPARIELSDPALVLKGAGHYATGCVPCHGAPGQSQSLVAQQMTPEPPFLPPKIHDWTAEQLFWIVKNGVKFTAMPAWVNLQRDDEVWAMVAFLQALPTLSSERYEQLAYGERADAGVSGETTPGYLRSLSEPLGPALANCARCHGADGSGRGMGVFPKLAGQSETYLLSSLEAYASGGRNSGIMQPIAADLSEAAMQALAEHYANQELGAGPSKPDGPATTAADPASIEQGRANANRGVPAQGVPSCVDCHGPRPGPRNPYYPELAGQYIDYIALQLSLFKADKRGGTPYARIMHSAAKDLTEEQMRDLALYYSALEPSHENITEATTPN